MAKLPITERETPEAPPWLDAENFLSEMGLSSPQTQKTYRTALRLFADWMQKYKRDGHQLEDAWPLNPAELQTESVIRFHSWLLASRSATTAKTYMAALMSYFFFLDGRDMLPEGVRMGKVKTHMRSKTRQAAIAASSTVVDMDIARQAIPVIARYYHTLPLPHQNDSYNRRLSLLRDRALLSVLFSTALRISEVVSLNRQHYDHWQDHFSIRTKGGKFRTIHVQAYAREDVKHYLGERTDKNRALFVAHSRNAAGKRLTAVSGEEAVKTAVRGTMSTHPEQIDPSLSAHDFRHYRATQLLRNGMPIEVVQEFLGHTSIETTRKIYAPLLGKDVVNEWLTNVDESPSALAKLWQKKVQST